MVRRRAIGASVAATLVFSSLLLTNFALLASAGQRERLSVTADSESLLADTGTVLAGTEGVGLLDRFQDFLASRPFDCSSANQEIGSFVGSLAGSVSQSGLTVTESAGIEGGQSHHDNLSTLSPFNGSFPDRIDLSLKIQMSGESALQDVAYNRTEVHDLNLPVRLGQMVSLCQGAVEDVFSALGVSTFPVCNASAVRPLFASLEEALRAQASQKGLAVAIDFAVVRTSACIVEFAVWVSQPGAEGPEGAFTTRLVGKGSAQVRVGA